MTGLREVFARALADQRGHDWRHFDFSDEWVVDECFAAADAVLGVLGDPDTLALIQRVLAEHQIDGTWGGCICGEPVGALYENEAAHQAAAVVAALIEEQT